MSGLRERILAAQDGPRPVMVPTPEWEGTDGEVYVRGLNAAERFECSDLFGDDSEGGTLWARYCVYILCDENGDPIFSDADMVELNTHSPNVLERLANQGMRHNAMTADAQEELVKNSEGTTADSSPTS